MSSRLARDGTGRPIAVVVTTPVPGLAVGDALPVLGNALEGGWLGTRTGRAPHLLERTRDRHEGARLPTASKRAAVQ
jgi:hypothetical protein